MKIGITPLIAENTPMAKAKSLAVFNNNGVKVGNVDISTMPKPTGTKLYSFGLISDLHITGNNSTNGQRLKNAMAFFSGQGCSFVCNTGDMSNIGFWANTTSTTKYLDEFAEYKSIRETYPNMPLYGLCGNHDNYNKAITETLTELNTYTGKGLYYTVNQGNDVYIFVGQPTAYIPMNLEELEWLEATLESNKNKRCFVFIHSFVDDADSGNPFGLYENKTFLNWEYTSRFKETMQHYKNAVLFHGHSHMLFDMQKQVKNSNYSTALGFKSIHIPSTAIARTVDNGALSNAEASLGYIVDVYSNHIVLKGYDFLNNSYVPIAQYCIDTTLKTVI